ncbi:MAG: hypothetical protein KF861_00715 [Planctomycetaceae bacterium]|nr:hypothetical protein [Planctomycetia bacterium]MBX3436004.1 hypothetical protein [Planctomycetaceae bacterium]
MNIGDLRTEDRLLIHAVAERMADIAATPNPPAWQRWERVRLDDLRTYGPEYRPGEWFGGGGGTLNGATMMRFRRAIHRLGMAGLLRTASVGGRTRNVKLTPEGVKLAAELAGTETTPAARCDE